MHGLLCLESISPVDFACSLKSFLIVFVRFCFRVKDTEEEESSDEAMMEAVHELQHSAKACGRFAKRVCSQKVSLNLKVIACFLMRSDFLSEFTRTPLILRLPDICITSCST